MQPVEAGGELLNSYLQKDPFSSDLFAAYVFVDDEVGAESYEDESEGAQVE